VQSNGGVCSAAPACREPVRILLSGPSGGAAACALLAAALDVNNLVGIDMGGTSFDVSVIRNARVTLNMQGEIDLLPVRLPMVEIRTIGAGGGSLAEVTAGGRLTIGPMSAGARPGPACYGRGRASATARSATIRRRQHVANRCCYRIGARLVDVLKGVERRVRQGRFGSGNLAKLYHTFLIGDRGHRIDYFL
jgi:N-methylhydantoinase A/oxoprolinase/acetone carboxylase beta subunit